MKTLILAAGIGLTGLSAWMTQLNAPGKAAAAEPEASPTTLSLATPTQADLKDRIARLEAKLEEQLQENERLAKQNAELREQIQPGNGSPSRPASFALPQGPIAAPIFFPEDRRMLGRATLYFQTRTNDQGVEAWQPVVYLPPGARHLLTRVVTNIVEREVARPTPTQQFNYAIQYPVYQERWPVWVTPVQTVAPAAPPNDGFRPRSFPRAGGAGFPQALPRAGGRDIRAGHPTVP